MWSECVSEPRPFRKPDAEFRATKYERPKIDIKYARMLNSGQVLPAIPIDPRISLVDGGRLAIETGKRNLIRADITRAVGDHILSVIKIGPRDSVEDVENDRTSSSSTDE